MRYKILYILIMFCAFLNAQTTTYDNSNIFGEYHLVASQNSPYSNEVAYNSTTTYSTSSEPRRASWDNGSGSAISDDGTVTVTYTWKRTGIGTYIITYSNGTSETVTTIFGYGVNSQAQSSAKEIANQIAEERRTALPIGDCLYLLAFIIPYIIFLFYKNNRCI